MGTRRQATEGASAMVFGIGRRASEGDGTRAARAFAEETAFVLTLKIRERFRRARRSDDADEMRRMQSLLDRTMAQRATMRRLSDEAAIRACADEWQDTIGYLDVCC